MNEICFVCKGEIPKHIRRVKYCSTLCSTHDECKCGKKKWKQSKGCMSCYKKPSGSKNYFGARFPQSERARLKRLKLKKEKNLDSQNAGEAS